MHTPGVYQVDTSGKKLINLIMARRKNFIATNEIYHLYNRSVANQPIFDTRYNIRHFINLTDFYRFQDTNIRYSHFNRLDKKSKVRFQDSLYTSPTRIEIYAFCIMNNHYHFLVKQLIDSGISKFVSQIQNGYAKHFNLKNKRFGAVFQSPFKAVRIESEEQFLHTSRYIHLNPLSSYVLKDYSELRDYPYSSFSDYISQKPRQFIEKEYLLGFFKDKNSLEKFTADQVDHQRNLEKIKHILL